MLNKKKTIICFIIFGILLSTTLCSCSDTNPILTKVSNIVVDIEDYIKANDENNFISDNNELTVTKLDSAKYSIQITSVKSFDSYEDSQLPIDEKIGIYAEKKIPEDCAFFLISMNIKCIKLPDNKYSENPSETDYLFNVGNFRIAPKNRISSGIIADSVCYFSDSYDKGQYSYGVLIDENETKSVSIGIIAKRECVENNNAVLVNSIWFLNEKDKQYYVVLNIDN